MPRQPSASVQRQNAKLRVSAPVEGVRINHFKSRFQQLVEQLFSDIVEPAPRQGSRAIAARTNWHHLGMNRERAGPSVPARTATQDEVTVVQQPGLDQRHRDKNGEIGRKHGNTLISTLRQTYGANFAPGFPGHAKLSDVLHALDEPSLRQLVRDLHR